MKPSERINRTYELKRTSVEIQLNNGFVRVPVKVNLELSPRPQVVLECEFSREQVAAANEIDLKREVNVRLDNGSEIDALVGNRQTIGGGKFGNVLIPKPQPVTVQEAKVSLTRGKFALINFPSMFGEEDITRYPDPSDTTKGLIYPRFKLEADPWLVEVIATDSQMGMHYTMQRRGGSAITHIGTVTSIDGDEFRLGDLEELLSALHLFLSFVRGSYCGITLLSAQDSNRDRVWEQWGTYKVEPWRRELLTWADGLSSHTLSPVFKGLLKLLQKQGKSGTASQVIHWYLRSNETLEPEVGIVLNQAALERLSFSTVGPMVGARDGEWIAQALNRAGIDTALPACCWELARLQKRHNWSHGPHCLVVLRNSLIHPVDRHGPFSESALVEAHGLGLHYIELMLLRLSGYNGEFVNRLRIKDPLYARVEAVPWSHVQSQ